MGDGRGGRLRTVVSVAPTQLQGHPGPARPSRCTWLLLPRLGQVCDARVGAHQDIAGVK